MPSESPLSDPRVAPGLNLRPFLEFCGTTEQLVEEVPIPTEHRTRAKAKYTFAGFVAWRRPCSFLQNLGQ